MTWLYVKLKHYRFVLMPNVGISRAAFCVG